MEPDTKKYRIVCALDFPDTIRRNATAQLEFLKTLEIDDLFDLRSEKSTKPGFPVREFSIARTSDACAFIRPKYTSGFFRLLIVDVTVTNDPEAVKHQVPVAAMYSWEFVVFERARINRGETGTLELPLESVHKNAEQYEPLVSELVHRRMHVSPDVSTPVTYLPTDTIREVLMSNMSDNTSPDVAQPDLDPITGLSTEEMASVDLRLKLGAMIPPTNRAIDVSKHVERTRSPALDMMLGWQIPVLDHGHIRVVDYLGNSSSIVQAARVSYGVGTTAVSSDRTLLRYLIRHKHGTPIEMTMLKLHMKMPIFVARQMVRYRAAHINEYSARYSIMEDDRYLPTLDMVATQSSSNKQGRGDVLPPELAAEVISLLDTDGKMCRGTYEKLINEEGEFNLARELARIGLTLNTYTEWYWMIDTRNLLNVLATRLDPHAQYEIRVYAEVMYVILELWMPEVREAFDDYERYAFTLTKQMRTVIANLIRGQKVEQKDSGLTKREWKEMMASLELDTE